MNEHVVILINMSHDHSKIIELGRSIIASYLKDLPLSPGVYRMIGDDGSVLYVGKAKQLKKRVTSYTQVEKLPHRLQRMVAQTKTMEFIITKSEVEALLLENNLIKKLQPRYNILLKDDKSFCYIHITSDSWPLLKKHRGHIDNKKGDFFGPFASTTSVDLTINTLFRALQLRSCSDAVFNNRTRPCLQYFIKRCSAPCVGKISPHDYNACVAFAKDCLNGNNQKVQDALTQKMMQASDEKDFEQAALLRDRIRALTSLHVQQDIDVKTIKDIDFVVLYKQANLSCIQTFFYRAGRNYGNQSTILHHDSDDDPNDILYAYLGQLYETLKPPSHICVNYEHKESKLFEQALTQKFKYKVTIQVPKIGIKLSLIENAYHNAKESLERHLAKQSSHLQMLKNVKDLFELERIPKRIEVYDNSHLFGKNAYGAMIVVNEEGFLKQAYRKFIIKSHDALKSLSGGDDYAMMREVMTRRFERGLREREQYPENWPDLILIDGGIGQLSTVKSILDELKINDVFVAAISKGVDRNAGREKLHLTSGKMIELSERDATLFFLQRIRDEVHRFVIGAHKTSRESHLRKSQLDAIPNIGSVRKRQLLAHFGSAKGVAQATLQELQAVTGISQKIAQIIYDYFHEGGLA